MKQARRGDPPAGQCFRPPRPTHSESTRHDREPPRGRLRMTFLTALSSNKTHGMLNNTKVSTLLTLSMVILSALLIGVGASGLYGIEVANDAHETTYENVPQLVAIDRQEQQLARARMGLGRLAADPHAADRDAVIAEIGRFVTESDRQWQIYRSYPSDGEERAIAERVDAARNALRQD